MASLLVRDRALPQDPRVVEAALAAVRDSGGLSPVERLEIYREQYWLRHTASLLEDFPGLSGLLGQRDWERLVEGYLGVVRSPSWTLRDLGYRLPEHVERAEWLPHRELARDMARYEWAIIEVFDAADAPPLDPAKLAAVPPDAWENARLELVPALALLAVEYPVAELRASLRERPGSGVALPARRRECLVIHRDAELSVTRRVVAPGAFALLVALADGYRLGEACERAVEREPDLASEIETKVGEWFTEFGSLGWVANVDVGSRLGEDV